MPRRSIPNPLAQAIGLRIKQLRQEQGVTGEKLAYESDVSSKGFLSDIEHGLAMPSLVTLERIALRLEVSLFDLLVIPDQSVRAKVVDLTRRLPKPALDRLLRELTAQPGARLPSAPTPLLPIRAYPTLEVAAGWSSQALAQPEPAAEVLRLPGKFNRGRDFAVRASGSSMQGFRSTIRDGDWLVMRKTQLAPGAAVGQVVLVLREDKYGDRSLHLKRIAQTGRRLWLRSDDRTVKAVAVTEHDTIVATLLSIVTPESLAPVPHTRFPTSQFTAVFGLEPEPSGSCTRIDGHLFLQLELEAVQPKGQGLLADPAFRPGELHPAETAFVLARGVEEFEYLGVATFDNGRQTWRLRDG
jgi:transcriptional regulator with XRE-family HTH domain